LVVLGDIAAQQCDLPLAASLQNQALTMARDSSDPALAAQGLEGRATTARLEGWWRASLILLATANTLRESIGVPLPPYQRNQHSQNLAALRFSLGDYEFEAVWAVGSTTTLDDAILHVVQGGQICGR